MTESEVAIRITPAEATVLMGFLVRFDMTDRLTIEDRAEQRMLGNLLCVMEKMDKPSWPSIEEARSQLRDDA